MSVGSLLFQSATRFPDKVAAVFANKTYTYAELNASVNRLARGLSSLGVTKGMKAALFLNNSPEWLEIYFALSKLGSIIVPINYRLMGKELVHIINHSGSEILFFDEKTLDSIEAVRTQLMGVKHFVIADSPSSGYEAMISLQEGELAEELDVSIDGEDPHTISYTSGTTGLPKGAVLTNLNIVIGHCLLTTAEFGIRRDDVFMATTPISQRIGWGKIVNSVGIGSKIVILSSFDYKLAMNFVKKERVTIMSIIPTIGRMILAGTEQGDYDASSLRMLFVTGEIFPMELKKRLSERFPNASLHSYFAQTEGGLITFLSPKDIFRKPGSVGLPFTGVEVKVVDDEMKEKPVGESGELIVRSYRPGTFGVMKEYYKDEGANKESFWGDWLRLGDMGMKDDEGHFYVLDRKKEMIISGGFNIYSKEVESILIEKPKILEVAVIGVPDKDYGEAVKAFIVLKENQKMDQEEVIEFCKSTLASYKKPKQVQFIDALPRNTVGKVIKYKLKEIQT